MWSNWFKRGNPNPLPSPFISPFPVTKPSEMSWTTKSHKRLVVSTLLSSRVIHQCLPQEMPLVIYFCIFSPSFLIKPLLRLLQKSWFFLKNSNLSSLSTRDGKFQKWLKALKFLLGTFVFFFLYFWMRLGLCIWNTIFDYLFINSHIVIYFLLLSHLFLVKYVKTHDNWVQPIWQS